MTDVAEALGVSVMTVSLALRDDPRIAACRVRRNEKGRYEIDDTLELR